MIKKKEEIKEAPKDEQKKETKSKLILYGDKTTLATAKAVLASHNVNVEIKEE